jgi:thiamine transport system permease protein
LATLGERRLQSSAWFSLWQAAVSTVLTVVLALPITWAISRFRFRGRSLVRALVTVPFVLPTVVVGTAFFSIGLEGTLLAIFAAHVFYNLAVVVRTVGGVWSRLDPSLVESARVLGASPWRSCSRVTLPLLAPALAAASSIVFLFTFTSFGVVLILGGLRYRTLEVEIYQQAVTFLDLQAASALAVLQLVVVGAILTFYSRYQERRAVTVNLVAEDEALLPLDPRRRWLVLAVVSLTLGVLMVPMLSLVARSLSGGGWRLLVEPGRSGLPAGAAMANSIGFAFLTTLIAVTVGGLSAWIIARHRGPGARVFDLVLMLPLGTSAVTIGFGFLIALDRPFDLRASLVLVPLAHALVAIPLVVRVLVTSIRLVRVELREAAAVLGADPGRIFRKIELPIVARGVGTAAGLAAAVSLGEFGATAFIARPNTVTVPYLIFRMLGRPGPVNLSAAMALAVLLAALTAGLILAADRARAGDLGSF